MDEGDGNSSDSSLDIVFVSYGTLNKMAADLHYSAYGVDGTQADETTISKSEKEKRARRPAKKPSKRPDRELYTPRHRKKIDDMISTSNEETGEESPMKIDIRQSNTAVKCNDTAKKSPNQINNVGKQSPNQSNNIGKHSPNQSNNVGKQSPNQSNNVGKHSPNQSNNVGKQSPNQSNNVGKHSPNQSNSAGKPSPNQSNDVAKQSLVQSDVSELSPNQTKRFMKQSPVMSDDTSTCNNAEKQSLSCLSEKTVKRSRRPAQAIYVPKHRQQASKPEPSQETLPACESGNSRSMVKEMPKTPIRTSSPSQRSKRSPVEHNKQKVSPKTRADDSPTSKSESDEYRIPKVGEVPSAPVAVRSYSDFRRNRHNYSARQSSEGKQAKNDTSLPNVKLKEPVKANVKKGTSSHKNVTDYLDDKLAEFSNKSVTTGKNVSDGTQEESDWDTSSKSTKLYTWPSDPQDLAKATCAHVSTEIYESADLDKKISECFVNEKPQPQRVRQRQHGTSKWESTGKWEASHEDSLLSSEDVQNNGNLSIPERENWYRELNEIITHKEEKIKNQQKNKKPVVEKNNSSKQTEPSSCFSETTDTADWNNVSCSQFIDTGGHTSVDELIDMNVREARMRTMSWSEIVDEELSQGCLSECRRSCGSLRSRGSSQCSQDDFDDEQLEDWQRSAFSGINSADESWSAVKSVESHSLPRRYNRSKKKKAQRMTRSMETPLRGLQHSDQGIKDANMSEKQDGESLQWQSKGHQKMRSSRTRTRITKSESIENLAIQQFNNRNRSNSDATEAQVWQKHSEKTMRFTSTRLNYGKRNDVNRDSHYARADKDPSWRREPDKCNVVKRGLQTRRADCDAEVFPKSKNPLADKMGNLPPRLQAKYLEKQKGQPSKISDHEQSRMTPSPSTMRRASTDNCFDELYKSPPCQQRLSGEQITSHVPGVLHLPANSGSSFSENVVYNKHSVQNFNSPSQQYHCYGRDSSLVFVNTSNRDEQTSGRMTASPSSENTPYSPNSFPKESPSQACRMPAVDIRYDPKYQALMLERARLNEQSNYNVGFQQGDTYYRGSGGSMAYPDTYIPWYYQRPDEQTQLHGQPGAYSKAEVVLVELNNIESCLSRLLCKPYYLDGDRNHILHLRLQLQGKFEELVLIDPDLNKKHGLEQDMWKRVFYKVIEDFRRQIDETKSEEEKSEIKSCLLRVLEQGANFYEELLEKIQRMYSLDLNTFLQPDFIRPEQPKRELKLGILSAHRYYLCLGDIARYKEQVNDTSNYGRARNWYIKAQKLWPKSGRVYNQLALLAHYTKRKLDAVYYYMRSLATSTPFASARESLALVFEEIRKKHDAREKENAEKKKVVVEKRDTRVFREVWTHPNGTGSRSGPDAEGLPELERLSVVELSRRFVQNFLHAHGKLFTKIGMESFPVVALQSMEEFYTLVQHVPFPISLENLLQHTVINMYSIHNTALRSTQESTETISVQQLHALSLGMTMFGVLVQRSLVLLQAHVLSSRYPEELLSDDLHQIIPAIHVWMQWMTLNVKLWTLPAVINNDLTSKKHMNFMGAAANLFTLVAQLNTSQVNLLEKPFPQYEPVVLPEESLVYGFTPLMSVGIAPKYVDSSVNKDLARDYTRMQNILKFGDYLCGLDDPVMQFNIQTHEYEPLLIPVEEGGSSEHNSDSRQCSDSDTEQLEEVEEVVGDIDDEHVRALREKKLALEKKREKHERRHSKNKAVLEKEHKARPSVINVYPLYLIPDTNSFVNHLAGLQTVVLWESYTLVVPLVVINELDGLIKRYRDGRTSPTEYNENVAYQARKAIEWLEDCFSYRNSHVRALTAKGSEMTTIAYRSECDEDFEGNNDDIILSCCLHYCHDYARDFMPKDEDSPIVIQREVVLLTEDKNLCVKAHAHNVPVTDVPPFIKWANAR